MKSLRRVSVFANRWKKGRCVRLGIILAAAILSALIQAYALQVFVWSADIISGGSTGIVTLIGRLGGLWGLITPMQIIILLMNTPVALVCCKGISVRFTVFSLVQVLLGSVFLQIFSFMPIFTDEIPNVILGGVTFGSAIVIALRGNASSGGADFITPFVSDRTGQSTWNYVLFSNAIMYCFYGSIFERKRAGYSIIFQSTSIRTISAFHHKCGLVTFQVTIVKGPGVVEACISCFRHGMSCVEAMGGYSKREMYLLSTAISTYEVNDAAHVMQEADEYMIINALKTQQFVG